MVKKFLNSIENTFLQFTHRLPLEINVLLLVNQQDLFFLIYITSDMLFSDICNCRKAEKIFVLPVDVTDGNLILSILIALPMMKTYAHISAHQTNRSNSSKLGHNSCNSPGAPASLTHCSLKHIIFN
ncbi:hypothetical protein V1477_007608 [Vespula maculifrons]|uniref:Uncharacterized protein n=1 Tax=Vespula maculifrons TaxID=7453 RepID=A0ABD2CGB7_VESMC